MKSLTLWSTLLVAGTLGGLVFTNPGQEAYEVYAGEKANAYLNNEVCAELPDSVANLFPGQCADLIQAIQPELQTAIQARTERLNLGVASIYRTSLGIPSVPILPQYKVETLGIAGRFITYRANRS